MNDSLLESRKEILNQYLKSVKVFEFVNADLVVQWIENLDDLKLKETPEAFPIIPQIILSLTEEFHDSEEFLDVYNGVYELIPQKRWNGKSPADKLSEKDSKESELDFYRWEIPDTSIFHSEAIELFQKNQVKESMEMWDRYFQAMYKHHLMHREVYRSLANRAMCHFVLGEEIKGRYFLNAALQLNKNYGYAKMLKNQLESGYFDDVILHGKMKTMLEYIETQKDRPDYLDLEELEEYWSAEEVCEKLEEFGVHTDEKSFRSEAKKHFCTTDISKALFDSDFTGKDLDEDFSWMAASVLADRWCSDMPFTDKLQNFLDLFIEEIYDKSPKTIQSVYEELKDMFLMYINAEEGFFKRWINFGEYRGESHNLRFIFIYLYVAEVDKDLKKYAEKVRKQTKDDRFLLLEVIELVQSGASPDEAIAKIYKGKLPYSIYPYYDLSEYFKAIKNHEMWEYCLLHAFKVVEDRDKNKISTVESDRFSIYDAYDFVLDRLEYMLEITNETDSNKINNIEEKRASVEKQKSVLPVSENKGDDIDIEEVMKEVVDKFEMKELETDPAFKYFEYLQKLEINYETEENIGFKHVPMIGSKKLGRNDPCPCGSGKKYKKCCME